MNGKEMKSVVFVVFFKKEGGKRWGINLVMRRRNRKKNRKKNRKENVFFF